MTLLVTIETVLLILMLILVAGLLRSHAEILRRLEGGSAAPASATGPEITPLRDAGAPAFDLSGETLDRGSLGIAVTGGQTNTLIAFLTSGCLTCRGFWDALREQSAAPPEGVRLVVVTRDGSMESPSKLRSLAPPDIPVIMSSTAWDEYQVPMSPYFVFVDGASGTIAGEGTAQTWPQVLSLLRDAILDHETAAPKGRFVRADEELAAAGIEADHPSLYEADDPALLGPTADSDSQFDTWRSHGAD